MAAAEPQHEEPSEGLALRDSAKLAGWGLLFWGAAQFAASVLSRNATAASAVQAALAEWGAGRMGIPWSDPHAPVPTAAAVTRRSAIGAGAGVVAAVLFVGAAAAMRGARVAETGFAPSLLGVGLVLAVLSAVRDELLLRGVVLRATGPLLPWWARLAACGACAAGARFGVEGVLGVALLAEGLRAVAFASLWTGDRGAWMAMGANTAWTWMLGSVTRGGIVDLRFSGAEPEGGTPGLLVALVCAAAAIVWARRRR